VSKTRGHPREAPFRYSTIDDAIDKINCYIGNSLKMYSDKALDNSVLK
jgi:hypothetical protein